MKKVFGSSSSRTWVGDDEEMDLEESEIVDKNTKIFYRTGKAIENAWDGNKRGIRKGGKKIKEAAK